MGHCEKNVFVLLKGYASRWDGVDWLSISFSSETLVDFTGFSAKFKIGQYVFENNDLTQPWIINLTDEQTAALPLGMNTGSLIVYDTEGAGKPFTTSVPVLVKDWVDGDVEIETYQATILATLDNQNEFVVNVETAKVSLDWVEGKISEHNNSNLSHPYILGLIDDEKQARINADNQLSNRIDEKQDKLTSENAGDGISITEVGGIVKITNTRVSAEWGNIEGNIQNQQDLQDEFDTKQDTLIAGDNITIVDNVISAKGGISEVDGGSASSVYLIPQQIFDCGGAEGE